MEWLGEELAIVESIFKDWETHTWDESYTKELWVVGGKCDNKLGVDSLDIVWVEGEGSASHKVCDKILFCKAIVKKGLVVLGEVDCVGRVWSMEEDSEGM